jgi:hypothetical protein
LAVFESYDAQIVLFSNQFYCSDRGNAPHRIGPDGAVVGISRINLEPNQESEYGTE